MDKLSFTVFDWLPPGEPKGQTIGQCDPLGNAALHSKLSGDNEVFDRMHSNQNEKGQRPFLGRQCRERSMAFKA